MSYGGYILRTGGDLELWEEAFGRYLYDSRFARRRHVLDIGPGRCWFTRQNLDVIEALEPEPELVDHYASMGVRITKGSVYDIPFPDHTFDGVFCCWLFEHLEDAGAAIAEIGRVLDRNGYLCLIVPSPRTVRTTFYDDYTHIRPFTKAALLHLAQTGGFSDANVSPLLWTKGGGKLARRAGVETAYRYLNLADRVGRTIGLANRDHLMLEAWR